MSQLNGPSEMPDFHFDRKHASKHDREAFEAAKVKPYQAKLSSSKLSGAQDRVLTDHQMNSYRIPSKVKVKKSVKLGLAE